jgi:hypothetical protein
MPRTVNPGSVDGDRFNGTLHERLAGALERGARAQEQSSALMEDHLAVEAALHDTLAAITLRREAEEARVPE